MHESDAEGAAGGIVIPDRPDSVERHAASELAAHLEQVTGRAFPVGTARGPAGRGPRFLVGRTPEAERLAEGVDWERLGEDGCVVHTAGDALVLAGSSPRGTLYAVYEFLQEVVGCRWLAPGVSVIPRRPHLSIPHTRIAHRPAFRYREPYFSCARDADWAARNRVNGSSYPLDATRGGRIEYAGFVHTFFALVPPEEFFETHPEYFSELDGRRAFTGGQLCLTNPAVADVVTERVRRLLLASPGARIASISQNDWRGACRCAACRAVDEAEGSPSGSLIAFVNTIAGRLESEFPKVLFDTLAYTYTVEPPRTVRPRRNVIVRLCSMNACGAHALDGCERNRPFLRLIRQWGESAPEVFVWDYFTDFSHYFLPYPNLDAIAGNIRVFAESGVTGVFGQADATPVKGCGDMAELRAYLMARLLWRPELNPQAVVDEFLGPYYGAAAEPLRDMLDELHDLPRREGVHFHLYEPIEAPWLTPRVVERLHRLFDESERRVSDDPERLDRVRAARLPAEYVTWRRGLRYARRGARYEPADPALAGRAAGFLARARARGALALREGGRPIEHEQEMIAGADLAEISNGRLRALVAPRLGGRLMSLVDGATGAEWMHWGLPDQSDYPLAGGYEEYCDPRWRSPGWREPYDVVAVTGRSIHVMAHLDRGLELARELALGPGAESNVLTIRSTLTNRSGEPREALLRTQPEFDCGDLERAAVRIRGAGGEWREAVPWRGCADAEGSRFLAGGDIPAGAWRLVRPEGWLEVAFEPGAVSRCLFDWHRRQRHVHLGLYSQPACLRPGECLTLTQQWACA